MHCGQELLARQAVTTISLKLRSRKHRHAPLNQKPVWLCCSWVYGYICVKIGDFLITCVTLNMHCYCVIVHQSFKIALIASIPQCRMRYDRDFIMWHSITPYHQKWLIFQWHYCYQMTCFRLYSLQLISCFIVILITDRNDEFAETSWAAGLPSKNTDILRK